MNRDQLYPDADWPEVPISRRYLAALIIIALLIVGAIVFLPHRTEETFCYAPLPEGEPDRCLPQLEDRS